MQRGLQRETHTGSGPGSGGVGGGALHNNAPGGGESSCAGDGVGAGHDGRRPRREDTSRGGQSLPGPVSFLTF